MTVFRRLPLMLGIGLACPALVLAQQPAAAPQEAAEPPASAPAAKPAAAQPAAPQTKQPAAESASKPTPQPAPPAAAPQATPPTMPPAQAPKRADEPQTTDPQPADDTTGQDPAKEDALEEIGAPTGDAPAEKDPAQTEVASSDDPDAAESAATRVPLEEIRRYVSVYNAVKDAYVDPVNDRKLMQSAIKGLLLDLDPHSAYLSKEDAQAFNEDSNGAYEGIGVEVLEQPDGTVKVVAPIDGTPAKRAGLKSGDLIIAVDGKPLEPGGDDPGPLRGKPGSAIKLTVIREGTAKPLEFTVQREVIRVASVRSRTLEPGFGYIRLSQFQADTAADFEKQLGALQQVDGKSTPLRGLVLDLRSNPGGLLTSAVQIADDLLETGKIVSTKGRVPISDAEFGATPGDRMSGSPVVVLVDAGSASASEVLAGALRDNNRARVVGSRTFGKGSVQTLLPLDNGDSVKLTTARYYTPSGKSIQALGIVPDVVVKPDKPATPMPGLQPYSEAALSGHLRGDGEGDKKTESETDDAGTHAGDVLDGDGPITSALAELKRMAGVKPAGKVAPETKAAPATEEPSPVR